MAINSGGFGEQPSFFDPTQNNPNWVGSNVWNNAADHTNRDGYWSYWLGKQGKLGTDVSSDLSRALKAKYEQGFAATQMNDDRITWSKYLQDQQANGGLRNTELSMDETERGINRRQYGGMGDARWLPRS